MWNQILKIELFIAMLNGYVWMCIFTTGYFMNVSILCVCMSKSILKKATTFANEIRRIKVIFIHTWKNQHTTQQINVRIIIFFRCVAWKKKTTTTKVFFYIYFLVNGFLTKNFRGFAMHRYTHSSRHSHTLIIIMKHDIFSGAVQFSLHQPY